MRPLEQLLTTDQVAAMLSVTEKTIANWRYQGRIPFLKVNGVVRYRAVDIAAWIESQQAS